QVRSRGQPLLLDRSPLGRRDHRPARHAEGVGARHRRSAECTDPGVAVRHISDVSYSVVNVSELEGAGPGGAVRFVRRELGCEAFGINWFEIPPNTAGLEHDESGSDQEEVNVIISGDGVYRVD